MKSRRKEVNNNVQKGYVIIFSNCLAACHIMTLAVILYLLLLSYCDNHMSEFERTTKTSKNPIFFIATCSLHLRIVTITESYKRGRFLSCSEQPQNITELIVCQFSETFPMELHALLLLVM